ncbi:UDP-N-acetylmuramyl-tripeptide synthetase [bacterium]|jgi:UDP-N-acetylmuramoyl-L-alanyl-D-glutamate--2,6-diaminopimelate ligase|nr:UDP-N-acetylmuramyl-tripeptide synthetase [bacterium]MBT3903845.1 UDP-N-acetylmuramyl-tripeptide synthetase [bacterium]MBT4577717.1 UDP-N-acetylmuramyl-tripeptide synthetase [bacterium]MBT5345611.1 UDP-N-acetylmuramyl-tripeptide synthetase [bacterium]MBT6130702.1 UDP-N-acetylmuramyl-tripeptide synthetase [bacterium]
MSVDSLSGVFPVACHTNNVGAGTVFVAINGSKENGARYIAQAIDRGASSIVIERGKFDPTVRDLCNSRGVELVEVENARKELATLSAKAAGSPDKKLCIIGVTGTKGKTTTCWMLEHIFRTAGFRTALTSTQVNRIGNEDFITKLTTRQPDYLHQFLKLCVERDVQILIMEVAAQATSLYRTHGIGFDGVLFTNFSIEHSEFYPSMAEYLVAKVTLFEQARKAAPMLLNADDKTCQRVAKSIAGSITYGLDHAANFCAQYQAMNKGQATILYDGQEVVCPSLMGEYNASNMLAALAMACSKGVTLEVIKRALVSMPNIPARLERYKWSRGIVCYVDYAHNPSSYEVLFKTLQEQTKHLTVVFGCGGERGKDRRSIMGGIADKFADQIVLTWDNSRSESTKEIVSDIRVGIKNQEKITVELNRVQAINYAYESAPDGAIVAILGRGGDPYIKEQGGALLSDVTVAKSLSI